MIADDQQQRAIDWCVKNGLVPNNRVSFCIKGDGEEILVKDCPLYSAIAGGMVLHRPTAQALPQISRNWWHRSGRVAALDGMAVVAAVVAPMLVVLGIFTGLTVN